MSKSRQLISFWPYYQDQILAGKKTRTTRLSPKWLLLAPKGTVLHACDLDPMTPHVFATLQVWSTEPVYVRGYSQANAREEGCANLDDFLADFNAIYPDNDGYGVSIRFRVIRPTPGGRS